VDCLRFVGFDIPQERQQTWQSLPASEWTFRVEPEDGVSIHREHAVTAARCEVLLRWRVPDANTFTPPPQRVCGVFVCFAFFPLSPLALTLLHAPDGVFVGARALGTLAGQDLDRFQKITVVDTLDECDHVAAVVALPAVPNRFARRDDEAVITTAYGARSCEILTVTPQRITAPCEFIFDGDRSGDVDGAAHFRLAIRPMTISMIEAQ
jgi:hypothetical protein